MSAKNNTFKFKIAIEFAYGQQRLEITRTDGWSVLDFIILRIIAKKSSFYTLESLAEISQLPRQVMLQIIIPLLRMGWIELDRNKNKIHFSVTKLGLVAADRNELPPISSGYITTREYLIDPIFGSVVGLLKYKNISIYNYMRIQELKNSGENIAILKIENPMYFLDEESLLKQVTYSHEVANVIDRIEISPTERRFVVFNALIENGKGSVDRYYNKYEEWFGSAIFDFVEEKLLDLGKDCTGSLSNRSVNDGLNNLKAKSQDQIPVSFSIFDDEFDMILGSLSHKKTFKELIDGAKSYLIIQTTFIGGSWCLDFFIDNLKAAADRKVKIIVLWGKDDEGFSETDEYKNVLDYFGQQLSKSQSKYFHLQERCGSHAKFIITDHVEFGSVVVIGSCNWLYSKFDRFEASVLFNNNDIVRYFLALASIIATGKSGIHDAISNYIADLSRHLEISKNIDSPLKKTSVSVLLKNQHYSYIHRAKNEAKNKVLVLSDKISDVADRPILNALLECKAGKKTIYYSTFEKETISTESVRTMERESIEKGVRLLRHNWNGLKTNHSKVLAWDEDDLVISSLNWLSSNASTSNNNYDLVHEIGVYLNSPKIAKRFIAFFDNKENHEGRQK